MSYVIGFLAGAVWGVLGACLNHFVLGRALRGGDRRVRHHERRDLRI